LSEVKMSYFGGINARKVNHRKGKDKVNDLLTMNQKEHTRLEVMQRRCQVQAKQQHAAIQDSVGPEVVARSPNRKDGSVRDQG